MNSCVLRNFVLPIGDLLFGQKMISRLKFLERVQWWNPEQITVKQSEELKNLVQIAYNEVPFYRNMMKIHNIDPVKINSAQDLQQFPVVNKTILKSGYPDLTVRNTGRRTYEARTSGSTGENFAVREDLFTAGWYRATLLLTLEWAGWSIGVPHVQTGMTLQRSLDRKLKDWILGCHYVSAYNLDDIHLTQMLEIIEKQKIKFIWGYPGSLYHLALYAIKTGRNIPLKSAVTWGDMLYPQYRLAIEQAFKTKVFDTYGCAEGFHIAGQCGVGDHYHIHDLDVIVEILDDNDCPVKPGTPGHVVVTRLHPGPMPLIRYRVGDIAYSQEGYCECGRGFSLLGGIEGRDTDIVITPEGNRLIVHFFTGILEHFPEIESFQVIQENKEDLLLRIVPGGQTDPLLSNRINNALKEKGTGSLNIKIDFVNDIPLTTAGKRRFIISKLINKD
jgi:phenylacetate-CoA ligase